jgi:predicted ATPase
VDSGLLFRRGEASDAIYSFKHSLVRDAAHETLLRTRRLTLHGAIATELMKRSGAGEEVGPEFLGHHCEQAGMAADAVPYYLKAGEQLAAKSAMTEARALLTRARKLVPVVARPPLLPMICPPIFHGDTNGHRAGV